MKNYKRPRWTDEEHNNLCTLLYEGIELKALKQMLPNRTNNAIIRRALTLEYRSETTDGIKRFYTGVHHRMTKNDDIAKANDTESTRTITNLSSNLLSKSTLNVTNREAINLAMNILDDYSLKIEPKIICELSTHILSI